MRRRRASKLLGVPVASPARAVNKKYRELARAAHPDRGGDEDLFKELSAARDALLASDSDSDDSDDPNPNSDQRRRSADFFHKLAVTLDEMYTGRVSFIGMKRDVVCADGTATASVRETLRVEVPRGARGGDQIVFEGKADEVPGCRTVGRLVFNIKELPHPMFRRSGAHLLHVHEMPLFDAICGVGGGGGGGDGGGCGGGVYDVEHLDARTLRVRAPRAREAFEVWRISGEGMPLPREGQTGMEEETAESYDYDRKRTDEYGDLFCVRGVTFPDSLSESQRAVLKAVFPPAAAAGKPAKNDTTARKKAHLRAIKRSEFINCISAFPSVYGIALYYEPPRRQEYAAAMLRTSSTSGGGQAVSAAMNRESVPIQKPRRWSIDDDDGFDAAALEEDDSGDCETQ